MNAPRSSGGVLCYCTAMQTDRVALARAVRRRLADHKMAAQLRERGWVVTPPADEIEAKLRERAA